MSQTTANHNEIKSQPIATNPPAPMTDDELWSILGWQPMSPQQRGKILFGSHAADVWGSASSVPNNTPCARWIEWAKTEIQSAAGKCWSICDVREGLLYVCRLLRVLETFNKDAYDKPGVTEEFLKSALASGLAASGFPMDSKFDEYTSLAMIATVSRGLLLKESVDEWRPGMRSGSGWRKYYRLTVAGRRLAATVDTVPVPVPFDRASQMQPNPESHVSAIPTPASTPEVKKLQPESGKVFCKDELLDPEVADAFQRWWNGGPSSIELALKGKNANKAAEDPPVRPQRSATPVPFEHGELVYYRDRVELCGIVILGDTGDGYSRTLLELLRKKLPSNRYVRMGGTKIAAAMNDRLPVKTAGINTVTGCVKTLRNNIRERLLRELNIVVQDNDVIANNRSQGYHFNDEKITVRDGEALPPVAARVPAAAVPKAAESTPDGRREWILKQVSNGGTVTRKQVESEFRIGDKTAKRDLADLANKRVIEFVRDPAPGFYRRAKGAK